VKVARCKLLGFGFLAMSLVLGSAFAQTETPVRLALIASEDELRPATDLLTAELSRDGGIALVERTEIERVLREQALSATGNDYLKLGQLLQADGLLIASLAKGGDSEQLSLRLVAVKPGVMLGAATSPWPVEATPDWARGLAARFQPLIPKVSVLAKDATPISVVNLRSAVRSREGEALERELTVKSNCLSSSAEAWRRSWRKRTSKD
jgi:hypothetical protein